MAKIELTHTPFLENALKSRYPQLSVFTVMLIGYVFAILAGFIGTSVGSHNFGIVFVWIAWWAILILVTVPFFGRGWCVVCPIPLPEEWLQRGAVLTPLDKKPKWLNLRVPKMIRNIWLPNMSFFLLALFSSVLLTTPNITGIVLAGMLFAAIGLSFVFERPAFCRYLCPVGGFIGLYSQTAPIELRIKNKEVCVSYEGKPCYNGSSAGYGCRWDVFPGGLTRNTYCGLCMKCMRTCPYDNIIELAHEVPAVLSRRPSAINGQRLAPDVGLIELNDTYFYRAHPSHPALEKLSATGLTDSQKWNIVAYTCQFGTTPEALANGKNLLAGKSSMQNTTSAQNSMTQEPAKFTNPARMLGASPAVLQGKILRAVGGQVCRCGDRFFQKIRFGIWSHISILSNLTITNKEAYGQ